MNRKELLTVLNTCSAALARTDLIPIYKCFRFDGANVLAYNYSIGIEGVCPTDEKFAVDGKTLIGLLGESRSEDISIELHDDNSLTMKADRSTFKLPFHTPEEFSFEDLINEKWDLELTINADFLKGLDLCSVTASRDQAQGALLGIYVTADAVLYSSDGDALTRYELGSEVHGEGTFMIPNDFCDALLSLSKGLEALGGTLYVNKNWAYAKLTDGYSLYGRMIELPDTLDFEDQIKKTMKDGTGFVAIPEGFSESLSRAKVVADQETAKTTITIEKGRMRLVTDTSFGIVRDSLSCIGHENMVANVSASHIQRSLSYCRRFVAQQNYCALESENILILIGNME